MSERKVGYVVSGEAAVRKFNAEAIKVARDMLPKDYAIIRRDDLSIMLGIFSWIEDDKVALPEVIKLISGITQRRLQEVWDGREKEEEYS